jgi:hypothetical protein
MDRPTADGRRLTQIKANREWTRMDTNKKSADSRGLAETVIKNPQITQISVEGWGCALSDE